jgi:hypothetical protein
MIGVLSNHLGNMQSIDRSHHADQMRYTAGEYSPAYQQAKIGLMNSQAAESQGQAQHHLAQANADRDPIATMQKIAGDPSLRALYGMKNGLSPAEVAAYNPQFPASPSTPGIPVVHPGNLQQNLQQPHNATMASLLSNPDMSLLERTRQASLIPGFGDPNHESHQQFQSWIQQQYTDPSKWQADTDVPPTPEEFAKANDPYNTWSSIPGATRAVGLLCAIGSTFAGQPSGTVYNWQQTHEDRNALQQLLQKYNLTGPVPPSTNPQ